MTPWAKAPKTKAIGSSPSGTSDLQSSTNRPVKENPIFLHPTGRWSVIGFLMTFNNFTEVSPARMQNLCSSWTVGKGTGWLQVRPTKQASWISIPYPSFLQISWMSVGFSSAGWFLWARSSLSECRPAADWLCSRGCPSASAGTGGRCLAGRIPDPGYSSSISVRGHRSSAVQRSFSPGQRRFVRWEGGGEYRGIITLTISSWAPSKITMSLFSFMRPWDVLRNLVGRSTSFSPLSTADDNRFFPIFISVYSLSYNQNKPTRVDGTDLELQVSPGCDEWLLREWLLILPGVTTWLEGNSNKMHLAIDVGVF